MTPKNPHLCLVFIQFPLCLISLDIQNSYVRLPRRNYIHGKSRRISPWLQLEPHQPSSSPTKLGIGPRPFYNKHGHRVHPAAVRSPSSTGWSWWIFHEDFAALGRSNENFESKGHDNVETYQYLVVHSDSDETGVALKWCEGCCFVTKDI